jgi:hypothetical protein
LTILGPASHAQTQIWLDEQRRSHPGKHQVPTYNMSFPYRLSTDHTISMKQLYHALQLIIDKHQSLRTSLVFDTDKNVLMQRIIDQEAIKDHLFSLIESTCESDEQLNNILHDEHDNFRLFDLGQGLVFRCPIVYHKQITSNDLLEDKDVLIFSFHHALFDLASIGVFLNDLNETYATGQLPNDDNTNLPYIDCKYEYFIRFSFITYYFSLVFLI